MKKLLLIVLFFILFTSIVQAKRMAPKEVEPLIYNNIKFTADHNKMGYVQAYDLQSGKKLWEKQVYKISYQPNLETDVQDKYITKLEIEDGMLVVEVEGGKKYKLDVDSKNSAESFYISPRQGLVLTFLIIAVMFSIFFRLKR